MKISFCELYLDQIRDLVPASGTKQYPGPNLELAEDGAGTVTVKGLTQHPISTLEAAHKLVKSGFALRQTASTSSNDVSSRSHTIFTMIVTNEDDGREGRLDLVDLAGSERLKKSESVGDRVKEAKHINSSLTALGKVVLALSAAAEDGGGTGSGGGGGKGGGGHTAGGGDAHVPYRDSKLTRLLKNSLSGNSHTVLLCTVNPSSEHHDETLNSLQFAHRCSHVQTQPKAGHGPVFHTHTPLHVFCIKTIAVFKNNLKIKSSEFIRARCVMNAALAEGELRIRGSG